VKSNDFDYFLVSALNLLDKNGFWDFCNYLTAKPNFEQSMDEKTRDVLTTHPHNQAS
jgi:hypothetical protein